jgi:hypothetical protein
MTVEAPARRAAAIRIHPAVAIVERTERLWQDDHRTACDRAMLIVQRLIENGHLRGSMSRGFPCAGDDAETPAATSR